MSSGAQGKVLLLEKGRRGFFRIIFGRTGIIILLLVAQILFLLTALLWMSEFAPYFWVGSVLLSTGIVLYFIVNDDDPVMKLSWALLIVMLPVFGLLLYLFIKTDLGHRLMIKKYEKVSGETAPLMMPEDAIKAQSVPEEMRGTAGYLEGCGFPAYKNTGVTYFPSGEAKFEEMIKQLETAKEYIFLEYFIIQEGYMWGRILDILARKAGEGVEVRLMYDGTCAVAVLPYDYPKKIEKLGIACKMFAPLRPFVSTHYNNRDHRKILVIDGKVGFTGGINLADRYINMESPYGYWKDTAVMLKGDAVRTLTMLFLQMWNVASVTDTVENCEKYIKESQPQDSRGYVIPYGDSPLDKDRVGEMVYIDMLNRAQRYVHIMTPYLILDNEIMTALIFAARRGVDVTLIMPHIPDKNIPFALAHSYYRRLMDNGVKIYEFNPGFVHAKVFVSDDIKAVVGTINLDYRSLYHHFECAAYLYDLPAVADAEADIQDVLGQCRLMDREELNKDSLFRKLSGLFTRVLAPLL